MSANIIDFQKLKSSRNRDTYSTPQQQLLALYPKLKERLEQVVQDPSYRKYEEVNYPPCMTVNPVFGSLVYRSPGTTRMVVHNFHRALEQNALPSGLSEEDCLGLIDVLSEFLSSQSPVCNGAKPAGVE